jgi:hypothetical protein
MADSIARAHARLVADHSLQFTLDQSQPPRPPSWLIDLLNGLSAGWPVLRFVFLAALVVVALLAVYGLARAIIERAGSGTGRRAPTTALNLPRNDLRPTPARARALLEEADRLAAEGRFDEAAHVLLYRTIDDLEGRRPHAVRPALTSRDIAALEVIPTPARTAFSVIAQAVEKSFFGARSLDEIGFVACRQAYQAFASPQSWAAGGAV